MQMLAPATILALFVAVLWTSEAVHLAPTVRDRVVACNNSDYVFVLNLQRKDFAGNPSAYQQQISELLNRAHQLTQSSIAVGFVTFSKKVEHKVPLTHDLALVQREINRLASQPPRFNGIATGDAMLAAKDLLGEYKHRLFGVGVKHRKLVAVVAVGGDRNAGHLQTFAASTKLRHVATHVFAVNLAGGASPKELYRIASDGTRGIFDALSIVQVAANTQEYAQVFCPCPLSWTNYENCTIRGRQQVDTYSYTRSMELPHNCIRNLSISFEPCDCPPDRVERSGCVNGSIRISTFVYSRPDNNSDCNESVNVATEPCGRATGCESFVCPPRSVCVTTDNITLSCNCTNANDIYKDTGCERCGDRQPVTQTGPCINGQSTVVVTSFTKINRTYCHAVEMKRTENCSECSSTRNRRYGPCVRGYQQVIVTFFERRDDGICHKNLRTFQRKCRLGTEYQCIGSALSGGQFVTYDGQLVDFPGPCEYLLTERTGRFQVRVRQAIKFPSLPQITHLDAIVIVIGSASYELTNDLVFKLGSVVQPLPYSDSMSSIEAIYSDDALVFATSDLYIQMRGSTATISVRTRTGGLRGILGNCDGSPGNDFTNSTGQDVSQLSNPSAALGNSFRLTNCNEADCCPLPPAAPACNTNTSLEAVSVSNCGHLAARAMSPFSHCGETAMHPLFRACASLYCRAKDNPVWQRSLVCSTMEAAAFRCYLQQAGTNQSTYPIFRTPNFCPKSCGHNAEFVDNADFCPRTCARHFFSSQSLGCVTPFGYASRNVNGQSPLPGCQCKPGFVLDGSNCVLPNECECISNLCIDRENRSVCEVWKAQGYCSKYPLQMRRYCKLTCDQCQAPCQDQISKSKCQLIKSQGRCGNSFYKQMCQLTCNPTDCECPPCKTVRGPCDPQFKNRRVVTYCYAPDSNGRCQRNESSSVYKACDECQTQDQRIDSRVCNYCTQEQVTRTVRKVREMTGEMKCIDVSGNFTNRSPGCECQRNTNRTVCYRNSELYVINKVSSPSADCTACNTAVTETRLRNVTCTKVVQRGECDRVVTKRQTVTVTRGVVRNCQCDMITERFEEMCVCPKPHWTPTICYKNKAKLRWFIAFNLVKGRCVPIVKPHKHSVPCRKRYSVKPKCKGCARVKVHTWYERQNCRCVRKYKETPAGHCCCPKPKKSAGDCIAEHKRIVVTHYTMDNHECHKVTREIVQRCACPKSRPIKECDSETGMTTVGKLVFKLAHGTCEEVRQVQTEATVCKKPRVTKRGECKLLKPDAVVKHRRVYYEIWKRIEGACTCKHILRSKLVACGCREPQVRVSKCPSDCPKISKSFCPDHCHKTRAVIEYRFEDGKCHPEERNQQDFPCCCVRPRNRPPKCEKGKILVIKKYTVKLVANACKVEKYMARKDVTRHCDLTDVRRERHGDIIVIKKHAVRHCKCVWLKKRINCPAKCPEPSKVKRCDGATGERVLLHQYYRRDSCHCLPMKSVQRLPVDCPEPRIERHNRCHREEPAIIIRRINYYVDEECHCKPRVSEKAYPCEQEVCKHKPTVRVHCHANQLFNIVTFYKRDSEGRCEPRQVEHKIETPACTGHGHKQKVKKCIDGRVILFVSWLERQNCKCRTVYHKRVIGSCRRYCEHKNHVKGLRKKQSCDKHTNQLVIQVLKWGFNGNSCVHKWVASEKRVVPNCPEPQVRRLPCDHETGKQRLETLEYHLHNCKCRGPEVKVSYRKCSCGGHKVLGKYCDYRNGHIIVRQLIHKWNFELDSCHSRVVRKSIPVPCPKGSKISHGPCVHGHMQYKLIYYTRDKHSCHCRKKVEKKLVNCHCPVIIRRKKCDNKRNEAVTKRIYRTFDTKKRRCVTVREKRHHRKCRCPKPSEDKTCLNGKRVIKKVSYRLVDGECEADKSVESFSVVCHKPPVPRVTECNKETCLKKILTYKWEVNPKNCKCRLRLADQKSCRCCGCPKNEINRTCFKDKIWKLRLVIYSVRVKTCSKTCKRVEKHQTEKVHCPERRRVYWSQCHHCQSEKLVTKYRSIDCHCRRRTYKTGKFRSCCCHSSTKVQKTCQESTGLWIKQISHKKLIDHKCVWQSKVKYLPQVVCPLAETPVTYGACDRTTCTQEVTKIINKLNKRTCSCNLVRKSAGTRTCCCLNTTPEVRFNCINNNMRQRITVIPVFDEATHKCTSRTEIDTTQITCGDGQTRVSDPPCIGETRSIISTRLEVVNCVCVNRTVDTRTEMCSCPAPGEWMRRCDQSTGKWVLTRKVPKLESGTCMNVTETRFENVHCNLQPSVVPVCNRDTCIETVTTTVNRLDKSTCTCVPERTISTRQCCCPTGAQTRSECINNQITTITTRQTLDPDSRICKPSDTTTRSGEIPCTTESRDRRACDPATRMRRVVITQRALINCVCQTTGVSVVRELCACPPTQRVKGDCNPNTCMKNITVTNFEAITLSNGTLRCVPTVSHEEERCCCTPSGQKRVQVQVQCDPETGNLLVNKEWKKFIVSTKECKTFHKSSVKTVDCTGRFDGEDKKEHRGRCDYRTGQRKILVKWYTHDTKKCKCKLNSKNLHRTCSCKHKPKVNKKTCDKETNEIVHLRKFYVLEDDQCVLKESQKRTPVACPENRKVKESCNSCENVKVTSFNVLHNCECQRKKVVERTKCCCPEDKFDRKCRKDQIKLTTIKFRLSEDRKTCERIENYRYKRVKCPKKDKVKPGKCNTKTCFAHDKVIKFYLHKCHCRQRANFQARRCCCPQPKVRTRCRDSSTILHEKTSYHLHNGHCKPVLSRKKVRVHCPQPRKLGKSHCSRSTGRRYVKYQEFKLHECRCVPKTVRRFKLCACPSARIIRHRCKDESDYRPVFKLYYRLSEGGCHKEKKFLYKEPCHCPKPKHKKFCDPMSGETLVEQTVSFQLTMSHGRRECTESHHEKPHGVDCHGSKVHRKKCYDGRQKIVIIEHRVHRCRCEKKRHVRYAKCEESHHRKRVKRSQCHDGQIIKTTSVYDPESGERHEQRYVKRVTCHEHPKEVALSHGCERRGEHGDYYRKVGIIYSVLQGCHCKQKRRVKWHLCRCSGRKTSHRCVHDFIEQKYIEEQKSHHGHCTHKKVRKTREHRCSKRPVAIKKGPCDRHSCKRLVYLRHCSMEDCKCKCKKRVGHEHCCTLPPVKKRFCKGDRLYYISTKFQMHKEQVIGKDSDSGEEWDKMEVRPHTKRWSKKVNCPEPEVRQTCNPETGVLTKRVTVYHVIHCKCQPKMRTVHAHCRCPPPKTEAGHCSHGRQRIHHTIYHMGKNGHCYKRHKVSWKTCGCPKPIKQVKCSSGKIRICKTVFKLKKTCHPKHRCYSKKVHCPPPEKKHGKCSQKTKKFKTVLIRYTINKKTCSCDRHVTVEDAFCSCHHLNRKQKKCHKNVWVTVKINHRLKQGECLPEESVTHKAVKCQRHLTEIVPGTCERRKGLSSSGTQIARVLTSVPVECHCKDQVRNKRVPCICHLIKKYRTRKSTVCLSDKRLVTTIVRYNLVNGKCKPEKYKDSKKVECHGKDTKNTPCLKDDLGDSYQYVLTLRKRPRNCQCNWEVVNKVRTNCGCRPATSRQSCVGDNLWENTTIRYVQPHIPSASCEPQTSITTHPVNCSTPRTIILPCNTHTCYTKEVTVRYEPKLCQCYPKKSYRPLRCCCPAPVISPETCNPTTNQFEQVTTRYTLVNNTCVLQQNTTVRSVSCDTRIGETNTSVCNMATNRQTVSIRNFTLVNCECVPTTRSFTQPCSCPLNERVKKGLCNGTQKFTTDNFYRQQYNSTTRECVEVLFNSVQRPCICNSVSVNTTCIGNILRRVTHAEELVNETCIRRSFITDREITCEGNGTSQQTRGNCDPATRTRIITKTNFVVSNCTCVPQSTRSSEVCNCFELNSGRQNETICRADNVTVRTVNYFYDGPGGVCLQRNFTTEQRIKCEGTKEVRQGCNKDSGKVEIRVFHLVPLACKCVWTEQPPRYEDCKCRKSHSKKTCDKNNKIIITTYYKLKDGHCQKRKYKRVIPIECDDNGRKAGERYGECSDFSGTRSVVKYVNRVVDCSCVTKRVRRSCSCRCPNSRTWSACKDNKVVTFRLTYQLKGCSCVKQLKTSESQNICKRRRVKRTACVRGLNGDGHLTVVESQKRSVNCRCQLERREQQEACLCQARENQNQECRGRTLTIVTTRRQLIEGVCKRVVVKHETKAISCPAQSVHPVSTCNKRGYRLIKRTTWKAKECRCESRVRLEKQRCNKKCDKAPKIVRASHCDKTTCTKRLYYYYKDEKCYSRHFAITVKCCCPPSKHGKQKCIGRAFETQDLFYKLQNGVCVMSGVKYRQEIDCKRRKRFETATSASGDTIVLKSWYDLKDCKCQKFKTKVDFKKKECQPPEVKHECVTVPEHRVVQTITRFAKQSKHASCEKFEEVIEKPVNCPLDIVHRGPCRKQLSRNAFVRVVQRVSFRKVKCHCEPVKSEEHEVCRCFQPKLSTRCRKEEGIILITKHRFEVHPSGSNCLEHKEIESVRVYCDSTWRAAHKDHVRVHHSHHFESFPMHSRNRRDTRGLGQWTIGQAEPSGEWDGHFSNFLEREVRVGCSCRVERRKRQCQSKCPKSTNKVECQNGRDLFSVKTTYKRTGHCRCSYRVRRKPLRVHLPKPKVVHHRCRNCLERIETIYYKVVDCKAKPFSRSSTRRCCCKNKPVTSVRCKAGQLLVQQTRTERLTKDGHCVPEYKNKYKKIICRRIIKEKPLTACVNGYRVWRRELERVFNCACKRSFEEVKRRCGFKACHPTVIKYDQCINCASKVTKTEFLFNSETNKCEAKIFHQSKKCCCPSPRQSKQCIGNRLRLITTSYKFDTKSGACLKHKDAKDITQSICKKCKRSKKTKIGNCLENGFRVIVTINPTLVDCQCHKKQSLRFVRCKCNPPSVVESCVQNGTIKYRKSIKEELDGESCKKIKDETFSEVECPISTRSEGICDTVSCQRTITDISYSVANCTCQRQTTQQVETCCCPPTTNETRSCDEAENIAIVTRQFQEFDLENRACVTRSRTDRVGTICPQNFRTFASPCDQFRNNSLYRTVSESVTVASKCECVPRTVTRTELCGCDSPKEFTECTPDNQLLTYRIEYKPNANNTICEPNRVILNVEDVVCDRTPRSNTPNCTTGTRTPNGETRITVVTTWQRAGSNCTCATQTRSEEVLCACPENSQPKTVCDQKRHEKLNVTTVYNLLVTGSIRQCIPSKVVTRFGRVTCQAPVVELGSCQYGLMTVKTLLHLIHGCECIPKHFKHQQRCKKHLEPCINKLPDSLCSDLDHRHEICSRNFSGAASDPELKQLADASALCDKQCNRCDGCRSIGGHWQFEYADKECLVTETRYPRLTISKSAGFKTCRRKCKKDLSCRSFDFYLPSSQCTLARVDRNGLQHYLLPRRHLLGALPSDNQHRAATRCNLYERICSARVTTRLEEVQLGCPKQHVSATDPKCKCKYVSLALGFYNYCYRTLTVEYFERSPSGVCLKRSTFLRVPCKHCRDHLPKSKCVKIDEQGGCSISSTAKLCAKTCRLCLCDGREFVRQGRCNELTGKRVDTVLRTEWVRGFQLCRVVVNDVTKTCTKCAVGTVIVPQPCISGRRSILHKTTSLIDGKCKESVTHEVLKCNGCYAGVSTSLGPCIDGQRTITSLFAVGKKHGHCKERKTSYQVKCFGCPQSVELTQPCIDGRRLRQVTHYVRLPNTDTCYEARFETEDRCGTLCHDQISSPECEYQLSTGQCSWNLYTRVACPSTCKRC